MDYLGRHGKEVRLANSQHAGIEAQVERFVSYLAGLSVREALRKADGLSADLWLMDIGPSGRLGM
jgi:hypothetical protein